MIYHSLPDPTRLYNILMRKQKTAESPRNTWCCELGLGIACLDPPTRLYNILMRKQKTVESPRNTQCCEQGLRTACLDLTQEPGQDIPC